MDVKAKGLYGWWMVSLLSVASLAAAGELRLVEAVKNGDKEAVRSLLKQHADVNAPQADGATALAWAAHRDDLETAELLIHAGANVNARNDYGVTPLWLACSKGNAAMIEELLKAGANPNDALLSGETPLMTATGTGSVDAVKPLLAHGADVNAQETKGGQTALMWAVADEHPEVARILIEHGADIHARSKGGFTPLLFAAQQGDLDSARILVAAGADVNESVRVQARPSTRDTAYGPNGRDSADSRPPGPDSPSNAKTRSTPSTAGRQRNTRNGRAADSMSPLLLASASGHEALSIFLVDKGADPNAADSRGFTVLHYAASHRNMLGLVKALLAHGANPNARLVNNPPNQPEGSIVMIGATPLLLAAAAGNASAVRALTAGGADPQIATKENTTPLMVAAGVGKFEDTDDVTNSRSARLETAKQLVELGADVNAAGENGWTALHGAAYTGSDEIVQLLVEKGAKTDVMDRFGQTPLSIAEGVITVGLGNDAVRRPRNVRASTADLLLKLGATPLEASGVRVVAKKLQ